MLRSAFVLGLTRAIGILLLPEMALAQSTRPEAPELATEQAATASDAPEDAICTPACRRGFTCVRGRCVSACNPPCGPGEVCSREAECVRRDAVGSGASERSHRRWRDDDLADEGTSGEAGASRRASTAGHWLHEGFYLRLAIGLGWLSGVASEDSATFSSRHEVSGFLWADEIAIGGSPVPGLVIGGGIYSATASAPNDHHTVSMSFSGDTLRGTADVTTGMIAAVLLGPFVDYYPNPKAGFHLQGAVGTTLVMWGKGSPGQSCTDITASDGSTTRSCSLESIPSSDENGAGWGGALGVGYEGWVSEEWSLGLTARALYVSNNVHGTLSAIMPSLMLSATYN